MRRHLRPTVVSWFQHDATRVGSLEMFAGELSRQLYMQGWRSVLCFDRIPPVEVQQAIGTHGVRYVAHDLTNHPRQAIPILRRVVQEEQPAVLHTHFLGPFNQAHWEGWWRNVPVRVNTDHGSRPIGWVARPGSLPKRCLGRFLSLPLSQLITVSEFNLRCNSALGYVAPAKIRCIYNGIATGALCTDAEGGRRFRDSYGLRCGAFVLMQVSHMIAEKGVPDLIEASLIWRRTHPSIQLCLVGEGRQRQEFEAMVRAAALEGTVVFTGQVPDLGAAYSAADAVCQVSRWQEAFGAVIAEAMSCERPVIAARTGGIPEIVEPEESGLLVNPGQPAEIAAAVIRLAEDPSLRESMGRAGRERVCRMFDLRTNVGTLIRCYQELLG